MDTLTLCQYACSDNILKSTFGGVYPSDILPKKRKQFSTFIMNLDPHTLPGSHWIAIHFLNKKTAFYFDSYGHAPSNKNILHFLKKNAKNILYNKVCFQHRLSKTCGKYCLYFLYQKVRNLKLNDLHTSDKNQNEQFIKKFIHRHFKRRHCCHFYDTKQKCVAWMNRRSTVAPLLIRKREKNISPYDR